MASNAGYEVKLVTDAKDAPALQAKMKLLVPPAKLTDVSAGAMTYDIPRDQVRRQRACVRCVRCVRCVTYSHAKDRQGRLRAVLQSE